MSAFGLYTWMLVLASFPGFGRPALGPPDTPQVEQARAYLKSGHLQEAETLLKAILKSNDGDVEAHHLLGLAYVQGRKLVEAIPHLERAAELNPGSTEILNDLGRAYLEGGRRDEAMRTLARSLALEPGQPDTQYSLGMLFLEGADNRQAALHLEQARAYGLKHSGVLLNLGRAYLNQKRFDEALEAFNQLLLANSMDWHLQFEVGKMLFEKLLYESAKPPLSRAWELRHESYEAGFYLALVHYILGEQAESLSVLLQLRARGQRSSELENLLAAVYAKQGQTDEATRILQEVMEEAPDRPDAYFNLGLIQLEQGKRKEAMALLERGGALYHNDAKIYYILASQQACPAARRSLEHATDAARKEQASPERASFYLQLGKAFEERFHYTSAAELLQMAWELDPTNPETLFALGLSCYNLDDLSSSLAMFRRVITLRPDDESAYYFLGNNYASLGQDVEAVSAYRKAIEIAPQKANYYYRLGKTLFRDGDTDEALVAYKSALSFSPNDAATHSAMGMVYLRREERDRAASEFQEAIRLNPGLPEPYYHLAQYYARKGRADEAQKYSDAFVRKTAITRRTPGQYAYVRAKE